MEERELFVISDLHIGGAPATSGSERGYRINTHVSDLVRFVAEIRARHRITGRRTELVINGDFVDFLAEASPTDGKRHAFLADPPQALAVFDAIVARDRDFFDALGGLLGDGVALTVVLGNHDLELSLPAVRERLEDAVGAAQAAGFRFLYDGQAHAVGDVLIEHGNRYDGWNVVDHDRLRRLRSESSRRLAVSAAARFGPPAGSLLVERVMNPIKQDYPFIDLLKPETGAALPLLLALEPSFAGAANAIETLRFRWLASRHEPAAPARPAYAGDIAGSAAAEKWPALQDLLCAELAPEAAKALQALLSQAREVAQAEGRLIGAGSVGRALSFLRVGTSASYARRLEVLLGALRALQDDKSFDRSVEPEACYLEAAAELAAGGFTTVVFGHTHLAKQVALPGGHATYLNTGTWADLIRVPAAIVNGPPRVAKAELERFALAIRERRFDSYLAYSPTFAFIRIDASGRTTVAALKEYVPGALETL